MAELEDDDEIVPEALDSRGLQHLPPGALSDPTVLESRIERLKKQSRTAGALEAFATQSPSESPTTTQCPSVRWSLDKLSESDSSSHSEAESEGKKEERDQLMRDIDKWEKKRDSVKTAKVFYLNYSA